MIKMKNNGVVFDEENHTYTSKDGYALSGITTLIRERLFPHSLDGISEETLRQAAERGTQVHKLCQYEDEMHAPAMHANEEYTRASNTYSMLRSRAGFKPVANEYCVTDGFVYATNIDCVWAQDMCGTEVALADIKTTYNLDEEYLSWQLSVNAYLFELQNPHLKVAALYGVWLPFRGGQFSIRLSTVRPIARKTTEEVKKLLYTDEEMYAPATTTASMPALIGVDYVKKLTEAIRILEEAKSVKETISSALLMAMEQYGKTSCEFEGLQATYVPATTSKMFDTKKFAHDHPELYKEYIIENSRKASLRFKRK